MSSVSSVLREFENLQLEMFTYSGTLESILETDRTVSYAESELLASEEERLQTEFTGFQMQASDLPSSAQRTIREHSEGMVILMDQIASLSQRVKRRGPSETELKRVEHARKQQEETTPVATRVQNLLRDVKNLQMNINKGNIDTTDALQVDDDTTLIGYYRNQLAKLKINSSARSPFGKVFQDIETILAEVQVWYDGKLRAKGKPDTSHQRPSEKCSKGSREESEQPTGRRTVLRDLIGHLRRDDQDGVELDIARLMSFDVQKNLEGKIYSHLHAIHLERGNIKTPHARFGKITFQQTDLSHCKNTNPELLKAFRIEAVVRTLRGIK